MPQSAKLAKTTEVMRRIEAAFASLDELDPEQRAFVLHWSRATYLNGSQQLLPEPASE